MACVDDHDSTGPEAPQRDDPVLDQETRVQLQFKIKETFDIGRASDETILANDRASWLYASTLGGEIR